MITYIDLYYPSNGGPTIRQTGVLLREKLGLEFIQGTHDLFFRWKELPEFVAMIEKIHATLAGTGAIYRFTSHDEDQEDFSTFEAWPPLRIPDRPVTRRER